jgi:ParB-like chromosome segregation protein Spo0J
MNNYQVMPPLSENEYESLKAQIARDGVLVPVEYDEDGNVLDGFHRIRACQELDIEDWPSMTRLGLTEIEKRTHARIINASRRHLSREQKRELVRGQLLDTPEWSNRRVEKLQRGDSVPALAEARARHYCLARGGVSNRRRGDIDE